MFCNFYNSFCRGVENVNLFFTLSDFLHLSEIERTEKRNKNGLMVWLKSRHFHIVLLMKCKLILLFLQNEIVEMNNYL